MKLFDKNWWLQQLHKENIIELDELEINDPHKPKIGEIYDLKTTWDGTNWNDNLFLQTMYEPADETIGGEAGWYWSKGWKYGYKFPDGDIGFEDIHHGGYADYYKGLEFRKSTLNELQVSKPKKYIPIIKPTKPDYINSEENFIKLSNYIENTNLQLQKEIGRLDNRSMSETGGVNFPITIDKASKIVFSRWFFENVSNFYEVRDFNIMNKWWDESRICLEDLERKNINELSVNNPNPTWKEVYDYCYKNIFEKDGAFDVEGDGYIEYNNITAKYIKGDGVILYYEDDFKKLTQQELNKLYREMKQLVQKYSNINELSVNRPPKIWDFIKYIPNFDPNNIKIGDKIKIQSYSYNTWERTGKITITDINHIEEDDIDGLFFYNTETSMGYTAEQLVKTNDKKKFKLNEFNQQSRKDLIHQFIKFCFQELQIDNKSCKIKLTTDKSKTSTYAHYTPGSKEIIVYTKNRSLGDIMRSLCHELLHFKQDVEGRLKQNSGETGSDEENEANIQAGVMLRNFGKQNPMIFENKINELGINKPNPTAEEVLNYYYDNIFDNDKLDPSSEGWKEYTEICEPYLQKYNLSLWLTGHDFKKLTQQELNKLYREMKQLVQKYSNINELQINKPPRTWDLMKEGIKFENIQVGDILQFEVNPGPETVRQKVIKKSNSVYMQTQDLDKDGNLKPNAMDQWDVWGIEDNWKKKSIHELEVNNPNVTWQKVYEFFDENINISYVGEKSDIWSNIWDEFKEFSAPYDEKYPTDDWRKFFQLFTRSDLNKFYQGMKQIYNKYNNLNESKSQNKNEIFSAYHGRYKFDVSKAYDLIKQGDIKTKIKSYSPEVMHFLSHPEFSEASPEKYNQININYNEPLGLIANFKDENDKNELMLIDGNHRTRKAVGEKQEGKYIVMYDPNDVSKILTINNEIPKKLFSDD